MILIPVYIFAGLGLFFGIVLAVASKLFAVKTDERIPMITDSLPGANCGGCGFSGCAALAEGIVNGKAACNACAVGGDETAKKIAEIMGCAPSSSKKMRAYVGCSGCASAAHQKCDYEGAHDCLAASITDSGKACSFGCVGYGNCVAACKFGAISVSDGVASVNPSKCTGCGACVDKCPKKLIRLIPADSATEVGCSSKDKGAAAKKACDVSCVGCGICAKVCPKSAIEIKDNYAVIDHSKCDGCKICVEKCPRHAIKDLKP